MADQTVYNRRPGRYFAGQIVEMQKSNVFSLRAESVMGFGVPAKSGTDAENDTLPSTAVGGRVRGVTVRDRTKGPEETDAYPEGSMVAVADEGMIAVVATRAVSADDAVTFDATDGTFGADAVGGNFEALMNSKYETGGAAGDVVVIKLVR